MLFQKESTLRKSTPSPLDTMRSDFLSSLGPPYMAPGSPRSVPPAPITSPPLFDNTPQKYATGPEIEKFF